MAGINAWLACTLGDGVVGRRVGGEKEKGLVVGSSVGAALGA